MSVNRAGPGRRAAWLLLIPLLLACEVLGLGHSGEETAPPAATSEATAVPAETSTALPTTTEPAKQRPPAPVASPTATRRSLPQTAVPALLPAPLYFIGEDGQGQGGQIMRLEADGRTLRQLTDVPGGILDFDVSPVDSRLVYVSGNKLIQSDPQGENAIVKVDAGQITIDPTRAPAAQVRATQTIDRPRFSPDGGQIAFGLNGVNLILAGEATDYKMVLPSDPYPDRTDPTSGRTDGPIRFFWPKSWSPDGRQLLVEFGTFPEGGGLAVLDMDDNQWHVVTNVDRIECCDWAWTADPGVAILASDLIAYGMPGLARVSPLTGSGQTIINGAPETPGVIGLPPSLQVFKAPVAAADGRILLFVAQGYQERPLQPQFHMAQLLPGESETRPLREDSLYPVEALWAPDGRGAVLVNPGPSSMYPIVGPLSWLAADGSPAIDLLASGGVLRWGPAALL
jgi:dipeptidyl aminopeptidase/acylaminoacyl peptidase